MLLGSLFSGIGGFELAATRHGITPVWNSEIEAIPISITKRHFPEMKHLGDITKINGADIEPVDIITFGSPCQDLSVAGKREGLIGERSGLFLHAIRIIREMRRATNNERPRFIVWENVPGAFSSNNGLDFKTVIEEITESAIPMPKSGRWANAGMVRGNGINVAWRLLDAQYWGVPQRRKRIFLVGDFRGECAGEILFKPESLSWHIEKGRKKRKETAGNIENSTRTAIAFDGYNQTINNTSQSIRSKNADNDHVGMVIYPQKTGTDYLTNWDCQKYRIFTDKGVCPSLDSGNGGGGYGGLLFDKAIAFSFDSLSLNSMKSKNPNSGCRQVEISKTLDTTYPDPSKNQGGIAIVYPELARTLSARHNSSPCIDRGRNFIAYSIQGNTIDRADTAGANGKGVNENVCFTLNTIDRHAVAAIDCRNHKVNNKVSATLQAKDGGGYSLNYINPVFNKYVVRRLTPLECERLQNFPDNWTAFGHDGKAISDSARYKAIGNSIAIPCAEYILENISQFSEQQKVK